jgi:hypothetical protein
MAGDLGALPALAELGERRLRVGEGDLVQTGRAPRAALELGPARERNGRPVCLPDTRPAAAGKIDIALGRKLGHAHADPQVAQIARKRVIGRDRRAGEHPADQGDDAHAKQMASHPALSRGACRDCSN